MMITNFSGWVAFFGIAFVTLAIGLVVLKNRRPEVYDRIVGVFHRKKAEAPQPAPAVEPTLPPVTSPVGPPPIVPQPPPVYSSRPAPRPAPAASVAPAPPSATAGAAGSGAPVPPERSQPVSLSRAMFTRGAPPQPTAIQMLHNFKSTAALAQAFLDCPNEMAKYCLYREEPLLRSIPREMLGVSAGWINACSYDGLLDGVSVFQCSVDEFARTVSINGAPPIPITATSPTNGWATGDGRPPDFYQPLARVNKSGADIVADFLRQSAAGSQYLRNLGLTEEAIAAARA
jgi:hypothetical protein